MKNKKFFTEEEDQIIILCLTEATSSNISDVVRKASTQLGRSFSSVYQRYLTMGKPTLESLKKQKEEFKDWKLVLNFLYDEPVKSWVTQYNYKNLFKEDWNMLMEIVEKIEDVGFYNVNINSPWVTISSREYKDFKIISSVEDYSKKLNTYYACVEFIKYWNKKK